MIPIDFLTGVDRFLKEIS